MSDNFYLNCEARGNSILLTYVNRGEVKYAKINDYKPTLFFESMAQTEYSELISGQFLYSKTFDNMWQANQSIREARDISGMKVYGNRNFNLTFLHENFKDMETSYDSSMIRGFMFDIECPSEKGFPEPHKAEWPINCMGIYDTKVKRYKVFGLEEYDASKYAQKLLDEGVNPDEVDYFHFDKEHELLEGVLEYWEQNYPQYLTGWHITGFDVPYLANRLQRMGLNPNRLSPWGTTIIREDEYQGQIKTKVTISGISDLDYIDLYKNNRFIPRESYKLDHIAEVEGVSKKVDFSEIADDLKTLYKLDWDLYTTYNIMDVAIIKKLEDKLGFLDITFAVAYAAGINFGDVSSPVATWENIFYRDKITKGIVLPPKRQNDKVGFEGGYVKPPQAGKHRWVCSFDLASLYPHLIMQYNISPETITNTMVPGIDVDSMVESMLYESPSGDLAVCPTGNTFTRKKPGVFPEQMLRLYLERKSIKKEMLVHEQNVEDIKLKIQDCTNNENDIGDLQEKLKYEQKQVSLKNGAQMVRKILLNSAYGALANIHFCLFDIRLAESITKSGQLSIRWIARVINEKLQAALKTKNDYIVYIDTDSVYVKLDEIVTAMGYQDKTTAETVEMLDAFCSNKMEPIINDGYSDLAKYTNAFQQKMFMDREVISDNSVFCAKKRYAMSVWNSEGVAFTEPYIKMMGLEVIKSSTPAVVRSAMKNTIRMLLNHTELEVQDYIRDFSNIYKDFTPEQIAKPAGVTSMEEKYCDQYGEFLPGNVYYVSKAAIHYNNLIRKLGIDEEIIHGGDKIKYLELTLPNKIHSKDIAFPSHLPPEFDLHKRVNYKVMYEKTFLKPMEDILHLIGWTSKPVATLDGLLF